MTKRSNPERPQRLQIDLMPKAKERLTEIRDLTESASYSEVIKRALQLYEHVVKKQAEGLQFGYLATEGMVFHGVDILT